MQLGVPILVVLFALLPLLWLPGMTAETVFLRWLLLLALSLAALYVLFRERLFHYDTAVLPLTLFIALVFLSALLSEHNSIVWVGGLPYRYTGFITHLCMGVVFLLALGTALRRPSKVNTIITAWLISAAVIAFIGILQYLAADQKSFASLLNSNHFGTYMAMAFPFAALRVLNNPAHKGSVLLFTLIYAALLTSLCRGAWVGVFFGLVLLVIYYPDRMRLRHLGVLLLMVTVLIAPLNDWRVVKQATSLAGEVEMAVEGDPEAGSKRFLIWEEALKEIPGSLIIGTGPDTLLLGNERVEKTPAKAHNIYLEIGVTMGIPALLAYLWLLGIVMLRAFHFRRTAPLALSFFLMVAIYLVQGFFLVDVLSVYPLFWALLGMALGRSRSCGGYLRPAGPGDAWIPVFRS